MTGQDDKLDAGPIVTVTDAAREKMARHHDATVAGMPVLGLAEFGVGGCHGS